VHNGRRTLEQRRGQHPGVGMDGIDDRDHVLVGHLAEPGPPLEREPRDLVVGSKSPAHRGGEEGEVVGERAQPAQRAAQ